MVQSPTMQEVRVESLERLETLEGRMRISADAGDDGVEQAYVVGAVADEDAFLSGDESLRVLCVRGRSCSTSRFEMPLELLSGRLGWRDVQTTATGR